MSEEEKKVMENDILFQIDMQLYDEFNDTLATMNDHLGDIYTLRDVEEVEQAEKDKEIKLLRKAVKIQQKELNQEKEKYKRLSIEAQATAFDDQNYNTECLLRVLLKQGEISLDEKGYYKRNNFDWEENLYKLGLMKKREKNFYIPDNECLDEYTKQLESQLKEYNELKEMFKKYYITDNETMYDGCCKMQDELDKEKEKNKELKEKYSRKLVDFQKEREEYEKNYISKDKIREKIEELTNGTYDAKIILQNLLKE